MLSVVMHRVYAECRYAECRGAQLAAMSVTVIGIKVTKNREIFQLRKVQILAGQLQEVRGGDELPQQARPEEGPRAEGGGEQTLQGEQGPVL